LMDGTEPNAGPGHFNDPDMLEVGNGKLTPDENRAHFALWAILAAPLIAGNDIRNMDAGTKAVLTDKEVLAIDQDPLGKQGRRVAKDGDKEVWARELQGGNRAVALLNRAATPQSITVKWEDLGYPAHLSARPLAAQGPRRQVGFVHCHCPAARRRAGHRQTVSS